MLHDFETPFPHTGSQAFVEESAEPVRIIQRNADGTCLCKRERSAFRRKAGTTGRASGTVTLLLSKLHATPQAAVLGPPSSSAAVGQDNAPLPRRSRSTPAKARQRKARGVQPVAGAAQ